MAQHGWTGTVQGAAPESHAPLQQAGMASLAGAAKLATVKTEKATANARAISRVFALVARITHQITQNHDQNQDSDNSR